MKRFILALALCLILAPVSQAALQADFVDDLTTCGSPTNLDNLSAMSAVAWILPTDLSGDEEIIMAKGNNNDAFAWQGWLFEAGRFYGGAGTETLTLLIFHSVTAVQSTGPNALIANGGKYVVGFTWAGALAAAKLYSGSLSSPMAEVSSYRTSQVGVGTQKDDSAGKFQMLGQCGGNAATSQACAGANNGSPFKGNIEAACIYNVELTAAQMSILGNAYYKGICGQVNGLVSEWWLDEKPSGTAANGVTQFDNKGGNNCTADDGGNNTGMTYTTNTLMNMPPGAR